jgi:hypothetical protein
MAQFSRPFGKLLSFSQDFRPFPANGVQAGSPHIPETGFRFHCPVSGNHPYRLEPIPGKRYTYGNPPYCFDSRAKGRPRAAFHFPGAS